jgi:hypothetical protein
MSRSLTAGLLPICAPTCFKALWLPSSGVEFFMISFESAAKDD